MLLTDDFDTYGLDGQDNLKAWNRLPTALKYFIHSQQNMITDKVLRKVKSIYGENGLKSIVKTSGFRSITTNQRHNGVIDSLHLYGCAIDFAKVGIFKDKAIPVCCELQCIDSVDCWHIQLKRGS